MNRESIMKYLNSNANEEDFKDILKQFTQKNRDFLVEFLLQLKNSNFDQLEQLLDNTYQLRVLLTDILQDLSDRDRFFYQACSYINTWNVLNKILEIENEKETLNINMQTILETEPFAEELLRYLYYNPEIEHANINETFHDHNAEVIENTLNIICDKNVAYKTSIGNYAAYDLTENSRRWIEKNIENRVYRAWPAKMPPSKEGNSSITVKPINFSMPVIAEMKFGNIVDVNVVYTAKVQSQSIFKFDTKNDVKKKYEQLIKIPWGTAFGKENKHETFEMAGFFKHTK